jgi:D-lactate dehydrogenase
MRVVAFDPAEMPPETAVAFGLEWMSFDDLLPTADVISLHVPLAEKTRHLFDRPTLARCRRGVLIVNTARGALIETAALDEALETGQVGGAGLDALEEERVLREPVTKIIAGEIIEKLRSDTEPHHIPHHHRVHGLHNLIKSDSVLGRTNVVFTPRVAFQSVETVRRLDAAAVANIRAFISGNPINIVQPDHDDSRFFVAASPA